ncbi:hypothetical protein [Pseudonocardia aurantiaca]|uniref:Secreted protein n=1 Tax=Pseudonocardia aurantiaca TaxID=75290 RepID=A0ABW4FIC0_9PSEU
MLKKAGIVVAATAASVLAVSPLAFASDKGGHGDNEKRGGSPTQVNYLDQDGTSEQKGLINVGDVNALNNVNVCPGVAASVGLGNLLGLLGSGLIGNEAENEDITCVNDNSVTQVNNR